MLESTVVIPKFIALMALVAAPCAVILVEVLNFQKDRISKKLSAAYQDQDLKDVEILRLKNELAHANTLLVAYKRRDSSAAIIQTVP